MKSNLEEEVRAFGSWIQEKALDVASELPDSRSFFKSNPSIPFTAKLASTNGQTLVSVSSPEDADGNKGGSSEGQIDMDASGTSDDERDDGMAVDDKVNKGRSSKVMIIMQGNSGESDIEGGDTEMQAVEQGNSEGGWEDGGGEDENDTMTSYDQRSDMDTDEKHGDNTDKDSEISEDVENGGNEQENVEGEKSNEDEDVSESEDAGEVAAPTASRKRRALRKIPKRKPRKAQEQKSDIRGGANVAGSAINPIVIDDDSDVFVGFFQLFSILSLILPQIARSGVSLEHQTKVKVLYLVSARNIQ